jgi:hypothetical protein
MVAYLDSSALLGYLLLGEITLKNAQKFPRVVSSELLEIECRRVLLRCRMEGRFSDETLIEAVERLEGVLTSIDLLELSGPVKNITVFSHDRSFNLCARALGFHAALYK